MQESDGPSAAQWLFALGEGLVVLLLGLALTPSVLKILLPKGPAELSFGGMLYLLAALLIATTAVTLSFVAARHFIQDNRVPRLLLDALMIGLLVALWSAPSEREKQDAAKAAQAEPPRPRPEKMTLFDAARLCDVAQLERLLGAEVVVIDMRDLEGRTPLLLAVASKAPQAAQLGAVRTLIGHGASINARDTLGNSALLLAVWQLRPWATGTVESPLVELLVAHGADPDVCGQLNSTTDTIWSLGWNVSSAGLIAFADKFPRIGVPRKPDGQACATALREAELHERQDLAAYFRGRGLER